MVRIYRFFLLAASLDSNLSRQAGMLAAESFGMAINQDLPALREVLSEATKEQCRDIISLLAAATADPVHQHASDGGSVTRPSPALTGLVLAPSRTFNDADLQAAVASSLTTSDGRVPTAPEFAVMVLSQLVGRQAPAEVDANSSGEPSVLTASGSPVASLGQARSERSSESSVVSSLMASGINSPAIPDGIPVHLEAIIEEVAMVASSPLSGQPTMRRVCSCLQMLATADRRSSVVAPISDSSWSTAIAPVSVPILGSPATFRESGVPVPSSPHFFSRALAPSLFNPASGIMGGRTTITTYSNLGIGWDEDTGMGASGDEGSSTARVRRSFSLGQVSFRRLFTPLVGQDNIDGVNEAGGEEA